MQAHMSAQAESHPSPYVAAMSPSRPASKARLIAAHLPLVAALTMLWSLVPAGSAYAYVDPSVMTYTIQAVAGLAVALSAVIGVVFRRTRRKLLELFNIEENAHKVAESAVGRIDPTAPNHETLLASARDNATAKADARDELSSDAPRALPWHLRFVFSLVMCVFMAFIVFIAPALEIFGSNGDSLVFGLGAIWWVPVVFCLVIAVIVAALLSLLQKRPFYVAMAVLFALALAAYVQSLFLNQGMMPADGGFIGWDEPYFVNKKILSAIVWIALIVAVIVACWRHAHAGLKATTALACVIIIVQLVGVISVAVDASKTAIAESDKPYVTQGSLLTVSPKDNVIVFVLDTYDTVLLEEIRAEDSHFLDEFEDFTYFPNCTGTMIPTANAIPNLLTALKPAPGQDVAEYRATKYERSTYLRDIHNLGYSIGMYSDSLMMDFNNPTDRAIADSTLNVHPVGNAPVDIGRTFVVMEQCALYREMPWVFKPAFWYYTSDVNNRMIDDSGAGNLNDSLYELDDAAILDMVRTQRLQATDGEYAGAFRFIHLFGPHFPFSVDEDGNDVGTNQSDQLAQAKGSMKVVTEYLAQLKELQLYDDATVIVTADHGVWHLTDDPPRDAIRPIMLVKPGRHGQHGEDDRLHGKREPVAISDAPVSHDDVYATVIDAMGGDGSAYGSTFFQVDDPSRIRYFDALTSAGGQGQRFVEYAIQGDAGDIRNWQKTGVEWLGA